MATTADLQIDGDRSANDAPPRPAAQGPCLEIDLRAPFDRRGFIVVSGILLLLIVLIPAWFVAERSYLAYGIETDYIAAYVIQAERLLNGEALRVAFHPPFYAAIIALTKSVVGDWQTAGFVVSLLAAAAAALLGAWIAHALLGQAAALGTLVALLGSPVFLQCAAQASSDVFFLALFLGCCALALAAVRIGAPAMWRLLGVAIGAALLTRTNAITLLPLLAAPAFRSGPGARALSDGIAILAGMAVPLLAWLAYALATGSPPWPTSNHVNLALTYFAQGSERISADAYATVAGRFDGLLDVVLHDPTHLIITYLADLLALARSGLPLAFPLVLLFLPGLLLLVLSRRCDRVVLFFGALIGLQVLLVNLKSFEARYYLFLLPGLGVGLGVMADALLRLVAPATPRRRAFVATIFGASMVLASAIAVHSAHLELFQDERELGEVVPAARAIIDPTDVVVARKPHLAFYTGARFGFLPHTTEIARIEKELCKWSASGRVHLFYGRVERRRRAELRGALIGGTPPPWLEVEATSEPPGSWVLYRYLGCTEVSVLEPSDRDTGG